MMLLLPLSRRLWACLALLLAPTAALPAEIVDAAYVASALARGAIAWDVRDTKAYADGHLPGAVNVGDVAALLRDPNREDWVPVAQVQALLGRAGIDIANREVIVYGRTGDPNPYWVHNGLRHFGAKASKVFHGWLDAWRAAGQPLSKEAATRSPVELVLKPSGGELMDTPELLERLKAGRLQLVDARTQKEFAGDDIRAIRGGHIPGAVNLPFEANWIDPDTSAKLAARQVTDRAGMSLKTADELRELYAGLDRDKEVIVYCQSGVRASVTATVLRDLGFRDVKVYEPSWLGYAAVLRAPAEREVFVNIGALNGRIAGLQGRLADLEAELAGLKGAAR
ncbi:MAG: sulfurtransferase [Piscinibacter sp.]|nr:sulfurtransferase [Piscinibacter sp.]